MATANDVVAVARSQIGKTEGRNNDNIYGREYGLNNAPYCCIGIWWCFKHANASHLFYDGGKTASCTALWNWANKKGLAVSKNNLRMGDIVFFDWDRSGDCDHVGIVESAGASQVTTIEFNTSKGNSGSQSNGDGVYRRYRTYSQIAHVVRPKYDNAPTPTPSGGNCNVTVKEVSTGSSGIAVKNLQLILNSRGYSCGTADGEFGAKTKSAVIAFQKAKGLGADGIVGAKTWTALFK